MVYETTSSRVGVPERNTFSLSRERETKSCRMDMQQKCCNNNTRSLSASPDTIRYYLYTFHPPPDRPTNQPTNGLEISKRESARSDITQKTSARSPNCISTYLTLLRPTRDLPDLTLPDLTSPHLFWIPPKKENFLTDPSIHPSEKTGPVVISSQYPRNCQKALLPYLVRPTKHDRQYIAYLTPQCKFCSISNLSRRHQFGRNGWMSDWMAG